MLLCEASENYAIVYAVFPDSVPEYFIFQRKASLQCLIKKGTNLLVSLGELLLCIVAASERNVIINLRGLWPQ